MLEGFCGWFTSVPDSFSCLVVLEQWVDSVKYFDCVYGKTMWRYLHVCDPAALHGDTQNSLIWVLLDHVLVRVTFLLHTQHTLTSWISITFCDSMDFRVREVRNHYNSNGELWELQMHGVYPPHPAAS